MINNLKRTLIILIGTIFVASNFLLVTPAFAASVTAHIRIVGTTRTIWFGDVSFDGCSVTDDANVVHVYTQHLAICALDAASKAGGFSYKAHDFGGSLGLFIQGIAEDQGAADFSTYWLYDVNGTGATAGISSQVVANNDSLFFHFNNPNADLNVRAINDGITYLKSEQGVNGQIQGFSGVSGWAAMSFAASNINIDTVSKGGVSLTNYLMTNPPASGASATEWERQILALTSTGKNPYSFGGVNYVTSLEALHTGGQIGSLTQINDDFFGLLALISAGKKSDNASANDALSFILSHQNANGGFSWSTTGAPDVDDSAAALQALVAAQNAGFSPSTLGTAITNAKNYVTGAQNSDGGFGSNPGDTSNTSTTSWADMAFHAAGVTGDPDTKAKAFMQGKQDENGSFRWQDGSAGETFTTSYVLVALNGKSWPLVVFTPPVTPTPTPTATPTPTPTATPTITPTPTVISVPTPTPTVSPLPTGAPKPKDKAAQIKAIREQQKALLQGIQDQIKQLLKDIKNLLNGFKH